MIDHKQRLADARYLLVWAYREADVAMQKKAEIHYRDLSDRYNKPTEEVFDGQGCHKAKGKYVQQDVDCPARDKSNSKCRFDLVKCRYIPHANQCPTYIKRYKDIRVEKRAEDDYELGCGAIMFNGKPRRG